MNSIGNMLPRDGYGILRVILIYAAVLCFSGSWMEAQAQKQQPLDCSHKAVSVRKKSEILNAIPPEYKVSPKGNSSSNAWFVAHEKKKYYILKPRNTVSSKPEYDASSVRYFACVADNLPDGLVCVNDIYLPPGVVAYVGMHMALKWHIQKQVLQHPSQH